jgi:hypothetical protein
MNSDTFTTSNARPWTHEQILEGYRKMLALPKVVPQAVMCDFGVHLELMASLPSVPSLPTLYSVPVYSVFGMEGIEVIPETAVPEFIDSHMRRYVLE